MNHIEATHAAEAIRVMRRQIDALRERVRVLEFDARRLNWLESKAEGSKFDDLGFCWDLRPKDAYGDPVAKYLGGWWTLRAAIDNAIRQEEKP